MVEAICQPLLVFPPISESRFHHVLYRCRCQHEVAHRMGRKPWKRLTPSWLIQAMRRGDRIRPRRGRPSSNSADVSRATTGDPGDRVRRRRLACRTAPGAVTPSGNIARVCVPQAAQRQPCCARWDKTMGGSGSGRSDASGNVVSGHRRRQRRAARRRGLRIMVDGDVRVSRSGAKLHPDGPSDPGLLARPLPQTAHPAPASSARRWTVSMPLLLGHSPLLALQFGDPCSQRRHLAVWRACLSQAAGQSSRLFAIVIG